LKRKIDVEVIPGSGISGVWFGDKEKAKVLLVYYHGGGFAMPAMPQHPGFLDRLVEWGQGDLAVFLPAYTTTSQGVYPQALGEVVEATRFVLEGAGRDKDVLIAGDSAGGQLAVSLSLPTIVPLCRLSDLETWFGLSTMSDQN
jgi:acetyl esterase/lipase